MILNVGDRGASTAEAVQYDNKESGLEATNVQGALDEVTDSLTASDNLKFQFATDGEGNYGYLKGDDTFVPFKSDETYGVITVCKYSGAAGTSIGLMADGSDILEYVSWSNNIYDFKITPLVDVHLTVYRGSIVNAGKVTSTIIKDEDVSANTELKFTSTDNMVTMAIFKVL